jgi:RNA polymerase sigma-70 factor (ECF subfamily)
MNTNTLKFESIYRANSDAIFRFSLSRVSHRDQALDITQETFLRLWKEISSNKEIANEQAFLFTVARNLIIDWYRKKKNININNAILEQIEFGEIISEENSKERFELEAEYRYILEKIDGIKENYKYPLYLRIIKDFPVKKIASVLGISVNAASVKISRGMAELRKKMTKTKKSGQ